jgi:hypothetical protein
MLYYSSSVEARPTQGDLIEPVDLGQYDLEEDTNAQPYPMRGGAVDDSKPKKAE